MVIASHGVVPKESHKHSKNLYKFVSGVFLLELKSSQKVIPHQQEEFFSLMEEEPRMQHHFQPSYIASINTN